MAFRFNRPGEPQLESGHVSVVHVIETLGSGGAERLLYTNLRHLPAARFRSTVVTVFDAPGWWTEPIRQIGVRVESLGCRDYKSLPAGVAKLKPLLHKENANLIHTHLWAANVVGRVAGRLTGVPVISSVHNPDYEVEAWTDGSAVSVRKRKAFRALDRWTARFGCNRMIAVSQYVRHSAHRHLRFPLERIELLYNPIDLEEIQQSPRRNRRDLLVELNLHEQSEVLLNVGRISPQKGLLYAIRALSLIKGRFPRLQLLAVGATSDATWLSHLQRVAESEGVADRVHFLGARSDIPALLRACDLFVFPSLHEGLGIALIEAMAAGCACVASATGPIPEVVRHSKNGWLVPPGDAESLAEAICTLLPDPGRRQALGEQAAAETRERFEPGRAAARLAEIYESVLRRN